MKPCIKWLSITLVLLIVSMPVVLFFTSKPPLVTGLSFSRAVYDEQQHLLRLTLSQDGKYRLFTPLSAISPQLIAATLLQEDQYFRWHLGINPWALVKASWKTYVWGSRRLGASTLSMQLARIRFGIHSKTWSGKIWQIVRALQLEAHYRKNEILEAYLNLAPYGNNIEGVGAASQIYFGKAVKELSLPEALTLVVIPQNPNKRMPDKGELKDVRNKLYARWVLKHPEDKDKTALMSLPLQIRPVRAAPFLAPHFVTDILAQAPRDHDKLVTSLDLHLQTMIEHITHRYVARKMNLGVHNAAVLLVDTRDMGIKAMLGSADFYKHSIEGQINGTAVRRSPGSALKPFIYALALDQGLIHPATVLKDVPRSFGSYNPENFDNDFAGPIKAKEALILSRNIPAVTLADQLKHPSLYEFLQQAGIQHLKSESYYGLALALGGAELSMRELVGLYAALANEGVWRPLRFTQAQPMERGKRVLSPEASFLVLTMLQDTLPPFANQAMAAPVAWKTGTSSGYRDAWTVGVFGPYVLAVWIGNFNNQGNPAFIGKDIAAPLFFEIVNALPAQSRALPRVRNSPGRLHLTQVDVCKASGLLPTRYCKDTEKVWFIPGKSPIKTDTIFREVAIDKKTGLRTCHINQDTRFEIYEFWSSDLLKIFKRAGIQRRIPPPYDASCLLHAKANAGFGPQIISPQTQVNYVLRLAASKQTWIPFTAIVDADVRQVHWFLNASYLGKSQRDQPFLWQASPGNYVIRVVDDFGRSDARDIKVRIEN